MKNIKKIAVFFMALTATLAVSVGCSFLPFGNGSDSGVSSSDSLSEASSSALNGSTATDGEDPESSSTATNSDKPESSTATDSEKPESSTSPDSDPENNDSSSESNTENSGASSDGDKPDDSSSGSNDNDSSADDHEGTACVWGEWELVNDASCTEQGKMVRYCVYNEAHEEYESFAARGHDYGTTGICGRCREEATIPATDANAVYIDPALSSSNVNGTGNKYEWYQLSVDGYYEVEIVSSSEGKNEVWFQFSVPQVGQYAIVSTSNPSNVEATQYSASIAGIYNPAPARVLEDGNFIGTVNCSKQYSGANDLANWRATFCLTGAAGSIVKFRIVKIAEPAWVPGYVTVDVEAKQISGKAPEGAQGTSPTAVPYDAEYFYDEEAGYYRMGTKAKPGNVIYVAITANASRLLGEISFVKIQEEGNNLALSGGKLPSGDYLSYNYVPFLMTDATYGGTENSYQAFVNSDGLYPVNQELYTFLQRYVAKNPPSGVAAEKAWLAACYYYKQLTPGSAENPIKLTTLGTFTAQQYDGMEYIYYTFTYDPNPDATGTVSTYCTISCNAENVALIIGNRTYKNQSGVINIKDIAFEANSAAGVTFRLITLDLDIRAFNVTIDILKGSKDVPLTLSADASGNATLTPIEILSISGENVYQATYVYVPATSGTLTLTTSADAQILIGDVSVTDGSGSITVTAGEAVTIHVTATDVTPIAVNLSVS